MRMIFGMLSEYFAVHSDGKVSIDGLFDIFHMQVISENAPVQLPKHRIVSRLGFRPSEAGPCTTAFRLRDEDGREIFTAGPFPLMVAPHIVDGAETHFTSGSELSDLTVPRCGAYTWEVLANDTMVGEITFHVKRHQPAPTVSSGQQQQKGVP